MTSLTLPSVVSALVLAALPAGAAFVYHDSATTTGGEFNASFGIGNLKNAGHTAGTDTEDASATSESYATTNPPSGGFPVTITLEFASATSLGKFFVWNHVNNGNGSANGVGDFNLRFYDAPAGGGSQIGLTYSGTATAAPASGTFPADEFDFGTLYTGVRSVEFEIVNKIGGSTSGFVAMREIGFDTVPEPGSVMLFGLGLGSLLVRRRR